MRSLTLGILKRAGLFLVSLAFMLVAAEAAVRVLGIPHLRSDILEACDRPPHFYESPPEADLESQPGDAALRIAVIGDSFTKGDGVQFDDRYGERLERMLNLHRQAPTVDVRVFAKSGTSTFQQAGLLEAALAWEADIVVLGICLNDAENWVIPKEIQAWRAQMEPQVPTGGMAWWVRHSRLAALEYRRLQMRRAGIGYQAYYRHLYDPEYSGWERLRDALAVFQQRCNEKQVRFLPVVFPLLSHRFEKGAYPFEFAHEAIAGVMRARGIDHLDLLDVVRKKTPDRLSVIPGIDPHPNEVMHRIIAENIHARLLQNEWIGPEYRLFTPGRESALLTIWQKEDDILQMKSLFVPSSAKRP